MDIDKPNRLVWQQRTKAKLISPRVLMSSMATVTPDDEREMATNEDFRERMRSARVARGWSQFDLAREVGTTQPTISDIERGKAESSQYVMTICRVLAIAPPLFFEGDLDKRWREAGEVLRHRSPDVFEQLLRTAESFVSTLRG
jgi:transcriptional regulator with XRE-family HTH domain